VRLLVFQDQYSNDFDTSHGLQARFFTALSQSKCGYAGLAVIVGTDSTYGFSIETFDLQHDHTVSGKPQLKKTIT
jgi:hypothetical protein